MINLLLHHKQDDSVQKRPLSGRFAINLKNVGPTFFKVTQMQSVSILSALMLCACTCSCVASERVQSATSLEGPSGRRLSPVTVA